MTGFFNFLDKFRRIFTSYFFPSRNAAPEKRFIGKKWPPTGEQFIWSDPVNRCGPGAGRGDRHGQGYFLFSFPSAAGGNGLKFTAGFCNLGCKGHRPGCSLICSPLHFFVYFGQIYAKLWQFTRLFQKKRQFLNPPQTFSKKKRHGQTDAWHIYIGNRI